MIVLREAEFEDFITIANLHTASWQRSYKGILSDHFLENNLAAFHFSFWQKRFLHPSQNQEVTVAVHDNKIVGFACLLIDDDQEFGSLLDNLHVSYSSQNRGIGKSLMQNCAQIISKKASSNKMYLWVYALNIEARKVYEKLGGSMFEKVIKEDLIKAIQKSADTFGRMLRRN